MKRKRIREDEVISFLSITYRNRKSGYMIEAIFLPGIKEGVLDIDSMIYQAILLVFMSGYSEYSIEHVKVLLAMKLSLSVEDIRILDFGITYVEKKINSN